MKSLCGIDLGTQSCKVILYDPETRRIVARAQAPLSIIARNDGTREQLASWYEEALCTCFGSISPNACDNRGNWRSGQQHGFVPIDEYGRAIRPIKLWNDTSTAEECEELTALIGGEEELLAETGLLMLPGYTAPKIYWLKNMSQRITNA